MKKFSFVALLAFVLAAPAQADWVLNGDQSTVSFVSTKAINVAEVHRFGTLTGNVAADGQANVTIDLTSVNTGIELRDERMREMLFDTANFATAQVSVKVDPAAIAAMSPGDSSEMAVTANLNLHGETREVPATVIVARSGESRLLVVSKEPVIVNASQFRLVEGVQALQEIAGLPSISLSVPVTFVLTFDMQ